MAKPRHSNMNIELLRIVAMFFVLACHSTIHLDWHLLDTPGLRFGLANTVVQFGQVGVCAFFMISGYFLARKGFSLRRVVLSWLQMFCYSVLILVVVVLGRSHGLFLSSTQDCFATADALWLTVRKELFPFYFNSYWFMGVYLVLMCLVPFLNAAVAHCRRRDVFALLVGMLVVSVTTRLFLSSVLGFSQIMLAICCYLIGAYARIYPDSYRKPTGVRLVATTALCIALMVAFNTVALGGSPVAVALGWDQYGIYHDGIVPCFVVIAAVLLAAFLRASDRDASAAHAGNASFWQRHAGLAKLVGLGGSATFGCYLLHENYLGWRVLWALVNTIAPSPTSALAKVAGFALVVLVLYAVLLVVAALLDACITKPLRRLVDRAFFARR